MDCRVKPSNDAMEILRTARSRPSFVKGHDCNAGHAPLYTQHSRLACLVVSPAKGLSQEHAKSGFGPREWFARPQNALCVSNGGHHGSRYRQVFQRPKRLRLHRAGRGRPGCVRSHFRRRTCRHAHPKRGSEGVLRHRGRPPQRQKRSDQPTSGLIAHYISHALYKWRDREKRAPDTGPLAVSATTTLKITFRRLTGAGFVFVYPAQLKPITNREKKPCRENRD